MTTQPLPVTVLSAKEIAVEQQQNQTNTKQHQQKPLPSQSLHHHQEKQQEKSKRHPMSKAGKCGRVNQNRKVGMELRDGQGKQ